MVKKVTSSKPVKTSTPSVREALLLLRDASVAEIDGFIANLHELKDARSRLESLFSDGVKTVRSMARSVSAPIEEAIESATAQAKASTRKRTGKKGPALGEPRPGSLRAHVHAALKELGPIKNSDLIAYLTKKLGKKGGKSLGVRVNQVLINEKDKAIIRVQRGVYKFRG
jgi:hypothetical protein